MKSFVVPLWVGIFSMLGKISGFSLVRALLPDRWASYFFVDLWATVHLLLAIGLFLVVAGPTLHPLEYMAVAYAILRIFELVVYQINVSLFDEYRCKRDGKPYALRGYRRLVLLLVGNYVEVIFWFALLYRVAVGSFQSVSGLPAHEVALQVSLTGATGLGGGGISPVSATGRWLLVLNGTIGFFMVLVVLGRFLALLPTPETLDDLEA